ncbi:RNA-directed DNA polymerase, eukaryota, reverse transcriptase zinc-binding domain protein [Tanacetum coccineum]
MERGLRQGDPLSSFLFIIVAEALQISILDACDNSIYNGLSIANDGFNLYVLQYADDIIFFGEWSAKNAKNLVRILSWFKDASGLKWNLTLSKVVLGSLPLYYQSIFKAPTMILKQLESIRRRFFGALKMRQAEFHRLSGIVSFKVASKKGLGIGSLRAKNLGFLGKLWWRFLNEKNALWCKVILVFYGGDGGFSSRIGSGLHKSMWENVISSGVAIDTIGVPFRLFVFLFYMIFWNHQNKTSNMLSKSS